MKIVKAWVTAIRVPMKKPFKIALGTLTHSNHVLVRLRDDHGATGWGEGTTFPEVYGYDQATLAHVLSNYLLPSVIGMDPNDFALINEKMDRVLPNNLMAKCAVDIAAHDLAAKGRGEPVYWMLGGKTKKPIPVVFALGILSPEKAACRAEDLVSKGAKTVKIKIGVDPQEDVSRVEAVRRAVGNDVTLRVDCNQGYSFEEAVRVLAKLERYELEWIEQPLPCWDLEGMARLCSELDTPVAADESVYTIYDAKRVVSMGAADVINVKIPKCGGIFRARNIAAYCKNEGVPCFLGGCIETTPGTAAQAHFYLSTDNVISAAEMEGPWCYTDDVVKSPLNLENGYISVDDAPGLGVEIDEEKVEKYKAEFRKDREVDGKNTLL